MKLKTIAESDMADLIKRSIEAITENPWLRTESDVKCALYLELFYRIFNRVHDLKNCDWRIATEYNLFEDCWIDVAILKKETPVFLLELKHLRNISDSYIREAIADFEKRQNYLKEHSNVYFVQVITSIFNGQHKELVISKLIPLYLEAGLATQTFEKPAATAIYLHVPNPM